MNTEKPLAIFVGFDERQPEAYEICVNSIRKHTSRAVDIYKLNHKILREIGIFFRPWEVTFDGRYIDQVDGRPFSTQFSHSRFLVPYMAKGQHDYAIFVDCDFVFLQDVYKILDQSPEIESKPVCVVKHNYSPKTEVKMDNCVQAKYNKKLWSSLMLFNVNHLALRDMNPSIVNTMDGRLLHTFEWLGAYPDENIGSIPEVWNFIPDHSENNTSETVAAIHYTEGVPHMKGYEQCRYNELYWAEHKEVLEKELQGMMINEQAKQSTIH